jgi:hypothetical protein
MTFEKALFISYAHIDNQPLTPGHQGWVTQFHASLESMLNMRMGHKVEIWRDEKLSGIDRFADEIVRQFPKTAMLVSVLSPRYVESDWCTREVREFCAAAEQSNGLTLDNKSRIVKVIKTPTDNDGLLPPLMHEMLGYEFYTYVDQAPMELDSAFGPDMAQKYNLKLAKLAWDIAQLLKKMEPATPRQNGAPPSPTKPAVYLAECSYDRREVREALQSDLQLSGYRILPDRQLPRDEAEYTAEVSRLLEQCKLSVHLVGSSYGAVLDGPSQKSVVVMQNELAIERSRNGGLKRVIWLPEGTSPKQSEQQQFIEALQKNAQAQFGADLITSDIETLKNTVYAALRQAEKPVSVNGLTPGAADGVKQIYIICDERDRHNTIPLRKFLKGAGFDVKIPVFEGDAAALRQANQDVLAQCDVVMMFYGVGGEAWKRTVESDLKKMKGYRGEKPLPSTFVYLAEPATDDKKDLIDMEEPNLINGLEGFQPAPMKPFLDALGGA